MASKIYPNVSTSRNTINSNSVSKLGYIPALDGLRALAVSMVMFLHAHFFLGQNGYIGVDVFFTLSGFLITTLLLEEYQNKGKIEIVPFYFRRTLRLFPALYVMLFFVLIYTLISNDVAEKSSLFKEVTASALYINNFIYGIGWWKNYAPIALGHTWSLAVEEQFYLVWPCLLLLVLKFGGIKYLRIGLLSLFTLLLINKLFDFYKLDTVLSLGLVFGCLVAVLRFDGKLSLNIPQPLIILSILFLLIFGLFPIPKVFNGFGNSRIVDLVIEIVSLIIILGLADSKNEGIPKRILGSNFFVYIGKISYSLYLWHKPVFVWFQKLALIYHWPPSLAFILKFVATFLIAILSWELIEKNIVQWGRTFLKKRQAEVISNYGINT
jgi:peptidoglycan/LPS O-acetylase OafA/YrhL